MKIKELIIYFFVSSTVVSFWIILVDLFHYLLTQKYFVYYQLPITIGLLSLIILLIVASLFCNQIKFNFIAIQPIWLVLGIFVLVFSGIFTHKQYQAFYSRLQHIPQVKSVTKNWTIQGDKVAIYGKNFGQSWQKGSVKLNDFEYQLVSWDDRRIVIEQPAIDDPQKGELTIVNHYGNKTTVAPFEIKDPSEVLR